MKLSVRDDYRDLIVSGLPLMDVRAPIEFGRGSIGGAVNLPLLNDDERDAVGKCYTAEGQDKAIDLGHELVSGATRDQRIAAWKAFVEIHPDASLFCFRGGLRSQISQRWLAQAGIEIPRVAGGYKAMRNFLVDETARWIESLDVVVLAGRTGTAKTRVVHERKDAIDLEGLANHRGSAFGRWPTPQPTQINFDNALAVELMNFGDAGEQLVLEDEGTHVGTVSVPLPVVGVTRESPVVVLEASVEQRVEETLEGYIKESLASCVDHFGEDDGFSKFAQGLQDSLSRIRKRLGSERFIQLERVMRDAIDVHRRSGDANAHSQWIEHVLVKYYDPMYDYQLGRKEDRVVFRGDRRAVSEWLDARRQTT